MVSPERGKGTYLRRPRPHVHLGYRGGGWWKFTVVGGIRLPVGASIGPNDVQTSCGPPETHPVGPTCADHFPRKQFVDLTSLGPYVEIGVQLFPF